MIATGLVLGIYVGVCVWAVYGRGDFALAYNPIIAWYLGKLGVVAQCIGARGYLCQPLDQWTPAQLLELYEHEGDHYDLWKKLGPLFPPVYLVLLAIYGYDKHPFEQRARRAANQPER